MELYHIADILPLLGIPFPAQGRQSFYVTCPCCDDNPRKRHLNINLAKDVFRCPRCGTYGGIFDLYSLYTGTPRDKVLPELNRRLGRVSKSPRTAYVPPETVEEYPITDVETRHATYSALLGSLSLAPDHMDNLLSRGLTECEIEALGYKTTPAVGTTLLAKKLQDNGLYLAGVPGFYRNDAGDWTFIHESRGILIPVRNAAGQIQGLQIRRDNVQRRKFRWVSSSEKKDGCRTGGWTHISGPVKSTMILTEGPMKADVIHALSDYSVIAVPGVNSLTQLETTLLCLREQGLSEIKTAFDMDFFTNCHVQNGYNNLLGLLDRLDFRFGTYIWNPQYKGLDDFLWEEYLQRKRV